MARCDRQASSKFVTRPIEDAVAEKKTNPSREQPPTTDPFLVSIPGSAYVYVQLAADVSDVKRQFSDINLKLNALNSQLPPGAVPSRSKVILEHAALMLTIASPKSGLGRDRHPHTRDSIGHTDCAGREEIQGQGAPVTIVSRSSIPFLEQDNTGRRATLRQAGRTSGIIRAPVDPGIDLSV